MKPLFSYKSKTANTIILYENNTIIKDNKNMSHNLSKYFTDLTKTLKLKKIFSALKKKSLKHLLRDFRNHSTNKIEECFNSKEIFTFREFQEIEIIKTIKEIPENKANTFKDIPVKITINSVHIYSQVLTNIFNDCVKSSNFPDILKYVDITPVFKKGDTIDKTNYRPVLKKDDTIDKTNYRPTSTLPNFSKVFEKMIYTQINSFMEPKLSEFVAGFRAKHNTQHALLKMIETWRAMLNNSKKVGAIVMDLSKAFDTLNLNLLLWKLKAYGFSKNTLTFIQSYYTNTH